MRPTKSRAWDKKTNSYVEAGFDFRIDGNGYVYRRMWGESQWDRTSDLDIEFSTGLTDKNGKEIHAGDIVRPERWTFHLEVIWQKYGWGLRGVKHGWWRQFSEFENIEIIGNIHSNPELLEEKNG